MIQLTMQQFVIFCKVELTPTHKNLSTWSDLLNLLIANGVTVLLHVLDPHFCYWAYSILCRKRLLIQGNFYIKQNSKYKLLSIEEIQKMLHSRTYKQAVSKLLHCAENVSGTKAYWNQVKEQIKAESGKRTTKGNNVKRKTSNNILAFVLCWVLLAKISFSFWWNCAF